MGAVIALRKASLPIFIYIFFFSAVGFLILRKSLFLSCISVFKKKNVNFVLLKIHTSIFREILNRNRPETQSATAQAFGYFLWGFKTFNLLFLTRIKLQDFLDFPTISFLCQDWILQIAACIYLHEGFDGLYKSFVVKCIFEGLQYCFCKHENTNQINNRSGKKFVFTVI